MVWVIFDIELIVEKVLDLLFFPRLTFTQEVNEFVLSVLPESRFVSCAESRETRANAGVVAE